MGKIQKFIGKLKPEVSSNLKVVVLCVVTATTFWLLNALNKDDYTTIVKQPVSFAFDQSEFMPVEPLPDQISIEINGNGWDLLRKYFNFQSNPFVINLEDPSKTNFVLSRNLERELAETLTPTRLVGILQDTIRFKIDKIISRKITVEPDTTENLLSENFRFASPISVDPTQITVRGPVSKIQELGGKWKVDLGEQNINQNFLKLIPLSVPRHLRDFLTLDEESVMISFEVVEFIGIKKNIELQKAFFPANVKVEPETNSVAMSYLIDERKVSDFEKLDLKAIISYNSRNREDSTVSVMLNTTPSYLEQVIFDPPTFKLIYE
ncbi:YbbR-like domain-containing protein [Lunatimonas salinarum]|uniref:YbbR-like domain-containing protein n=1 Tax=Lunatimonas salinarum TaxID=1774590 RepID=UPI001ADED20F|nr:YbbR-like domain-containing protein [Lunatimonas salinarum]